MALLETIKLPEKSIEERKILFKNRLSSMLNGLINDANKRKDAMANLPKEYRLEESDFISALGADAAGYATLKAKIEDILAFAESLRG